jgi:hypothetical protein
MRAPPFLPKGPDVSDIALATGPAAAHTKGTKAAEFLLRRGALLMKEMRPFGNLRDNHGANLELETYVCTVAKSSTSREETSYSVRLACSNNGRESAALIDFDELDEIERVLRFIESSAAKIAGQKRDYTELIYSTKDNLQFGFYHDVAGRQMFFLKTDPHSHFFLEVDQIHRICEMFSKARAHLASKGAGQ